MADGQSTKLTLQLDNKAFVVEICDGQDGKYLRISEVSLTFFINPSYRMEFKCYDCLSLLGCGLRELHVAASKRRRDKVKQFSVTSVICHCFYAFHCFTFC